MFCMFVYVLQRLFYSQSLAFLAHCIASKVGAVWWKYHKVYFYFSIRLRGAKREFWIEAVYIYNKYINIRSFTQQNKYAKFIVYKFVSREICLQAALRHCHTLLFEALEFQLRLTVGCRGSRILQGPRGDSGQ